MLVERTAGLLCPTGPCEIQEWLGVFNSVGTFLEYEIFALYNFFDQI